jgi:diaminohydroxyphosphoribosylaminopyrimidine deaminase/5-amino-6-(5-phosphoribosylamino)uracil reductase
MYLARACELAQRGAPSTSPNPPVGAVVVGGHQTFGEGYHHRYGAPHAEVEAIRDARAHGYELQGSTLYVSLEPCNHHGATPPCTEAILDARFSRVVIGAADPNAKTAGAGIERLRASGIDVILTDDAWARRLIEPFSVWIRASRPFLTLKMAASLDGYVAPEPGSYWLTSDASRERVRELRFSHDAVMVGAGTVRVDDPQLTVRPPHARLRPYTRVIVCEEAPVPVDSRVFVPANEYARTIVLAPAGARESFAPLEAVAECIYVGEAHSLKLDLAEALVALRAAGIASVLCEGGPTLATGLLGAKLVDRLVWFVAPVLLCTQKAVPVLARELPSELDALTFQEVERSGDDLMLVAKIDPDV